MILENEYKRIFMRQNEPKWHLLVSDCQQNLWSFKTCPRIKLN